MDIKDPRYRKLVEDYGNDEEFLSFSPEEQDSILETAFQKNYGEIPKSGNFLEKAISRTLGKPLFSTSDIVPIAHQFAEGVSQNAPQNIAQNPMTMAMSGLPGVQAKAGAQTYNIASIIPGLKDKINPIENENTIIEDNPNLTPQTLGGKAIGLGANILGGSVLPAVGVAKSIPKLTKPLRTGPINKELRATEDLMSQSKNLEAPLKNEMGRIKKVGSYLKARKGRTDVKVSEELSGLEKQKLKEAKCRGLLCRKQG